ncbi:MAG: hypothetical protein FWC99_05440 [Coriobacteriia bacterium]|nr:hypothetical protein [Coriobacteriia bacterium]
MAGLSRTHAAAVSKLSIVFVLSLALLAGGVLPAFQQIPFLQTHQAQASPTITTTGREIMAWGTNTMGQLGLGVTGGNRLTPEQVGNRTDWVQLAVSSSHTVALSEDGELWSWGSNQNGQLGLGDLTSRNEPTRIGTDNNWVRVSAYGAHNLALRDDGSLWAWGANGAGQIGNNTTSAPLDGVRSPVRVGTANNWTDVAAGNTFSFAVNDQGQLWGWGSNTAGRLGGNLPLTQYLTPQRIGTGTHWESVSAGNVHTVMITDAGHLYAWGSNPSGQLGNGDFGTGADRAVPTRIGTADDWVQASAGNAQTFAINEAGQLWGTGGNTNGELGLGVTDVRRTTLQRVPGDHVWRYVAHGRTQAAAITESNQLWMWGGNLHGQLGQGDVGNATNRNVPTRVGLAASWIHVATGSSFTIGVGPYNVSMDVPLTKTLRMPESVTTPNVSFNFEVDPVGWMPLNGSTLLPPTQPFFPTVGNQTINFTSADTGTVAGGVRTVTRSVSDILAGTDFTQTGVYVWEVSEESSSSGMSDPYSMTYSSARYEVRVYVQPGILRPHISAITVTVLSVDGPGQTVDHKTEEMLFTNTLLRIVGEPGLTGHNAFELQKRVDGDFADLDTQFTFALNLLNPALGSVASPLTAYVVSVEDPTVSLRTVTITNRAASFSLAHGERLVIPRLYAGTGFNAIELADARFAPSATVVLGGVAQTPPYSEDPGDLLATGDYIIANTGRNAIEFVNTHQFSPPTGLNMSVGAIGVLFVMAGAALATLLATRRRKSIERLSVSE